MKKYILFFFISTFMIGKEMNAQTPTTAYDFNMNDCNGKMHHLFSELDSGNVVIMEFIMLSCSPCIVAGKSLDAMVVPLKKKYGEKVRFYQMGFTKSYTCSQIQNWVTTNGFATSVPFDSGDVQVAYYGGMGMPTVAVVGGKGHDVLFTSMDYKPNTDTATISAAIDKFFHPTGISVYSDISQSISIFPNPASNQISVEFKLESASSLKLYLMNIEGQILIDILRDDFSPGTLNRSIKLPQLKNGVYYLKGELDKNSFTKKLVIVN